MSWKNRLLISLCKGPPQPPSEIHKLLIVSTTALGDTLWATPALANLRKRYSSAQIDVLTSPIGEQVLRHHPDLNHLIVLEEPLLPHFLPLLHRLKTIAYDAALIFHASQRLALPLCALSKIPRILGTKGLNKGLDALLTDPIEPRSEHEIERRLRIAEHLGAAPHIRTLSYTVKPEEREQAKAFIQSKKKLKIAMHPGSKEPFRRWPIECFAKLGKLLQEKFDCELFLTGSPAESSLLEDLKERLPTAKLADSKAPIRFLGAFLEQMDLFISNDTGPFHLACALNVPTVGIYVSTDPTICGPYQAKNALVISRKPTCTPCLKRGCNAPFCFLQIPPSELFAACNQLLER